MKNFSVLQLGKIKVGLRYTAVVSIIQCNEFHSCAVRLDIIKVFFISPTDALYIYYLQLKFTLKFTLKSLLHVSV